MQINTQLHMTLITDSQTHRATDYTCGWGGSCSCGGEGGGTIGRMNNIENMGCAMTTRGFGLCAMPS